MHKLTIGTVSAAAMLAVALLPVGAQAAPERELAQAEADDAHYARALSLYRAAAEAGDRHAQQTSGLMLYYGERLYGAEVGRDLAAARRYFEMAAAQGCEVSRFMLRKLAGPRAA